MFHLPRRAGVTGVGIHNTYNDTTDYPYLAEALDACASYVSTDWTTAPADGVLSEVLLRG
jgi:hypothetical protein